jgi:hypothetical protein
MRARPVLLAGLICALAAPNAIGQQVVIDEGRFRLSINGREVGTETFAIRQTGTGDNAVITATGQITLDTARAAQELTSQLRVTGASWRPATYQVAVTGANKEQIQGHVVGGRFSATILSPAGEEMREYTASDGAVVADEGVAHHYFFVARRVSDEGGQVPVLIPRRNQQLMARVSNRGNESVTVGSGNLPARRLLVTIPGGGERHVWVDTQGRVLRLEIPARSFVAARQAAPK